MAKKTVDETGTSEAGPEILKKGTKRPPIKRHGFGNLPPEVRSSIARLGGIAAHKAGTAHVFTSDEAKAAGHKGGRAAAHARKKEAQDGSP